MCSAYLLDGYSSRLADLRALAPIRGRGLHLSWLVVCQQLIHATSWSADAATTPERRKLHPETAFNLRVLHCAPEGRLGA